jgi:hypothetical protein
MKRLMAVLRTAFVVAACMAASLILLSSLSVLDTDLLTLLG